MTATWYVNGESLARYGFRPAPPPAGRRVGVSRERPGTPLPGLAGEADLGSAFSSRARLITVPGHVRGSDLSDALAKARTLLALCSRGTVELRCVDATDRIISAEFAGERHVEAAFPQLKPSQQWVAVTLRFWAKDPAWRDRDPLDRALGQTAVACPVGDSLPSPWTIHVFGSADGAVTDPQILYADAEGTTVQSMTLTGSLTSWATDPTALWEISTEGLVLRIRKRLLGVWADDDAALSAGAAFQLSPLDGWTADEAYPTVRLFDAAGRATGRLSWRRRYEL